MNTPWCDPARSTMVLVVQIQSTVPSDHCLVIPRICSGFFWQILQSLFFHSSPLPLFLCPPSIGSSAVDHGSGLSEFFHCFSTPPNWVTNLADHNSASCLPVVPQLMGFRGLIQVHRIFSLLQATPPAWVTIVAEFLSPNSISRLVLEQKSTYARNHNPP